MATSPGLIFVEGSDTVTPLILVLPVSMSVFSLARENSGSDSESHLSNLMPDSEVTAGVVVMVLLFFMP